MKRAVFVLLLTATAAVRGQQPAAPAAPTGERAIQGRVASTDNDAALPRVRIAVAGTGSIGAVFTDDRGRFVLQVPAATTALVASKAGYAVASFPLPRNAARAPELEIRMERGAAVSGRVTDAAGIPVVLAPVTVSRVSEGRTRQPSPAIHAITTDDLGEYRVGGLAAGRYTVTVTSPPLAAGFEPARAARPPSVDRVVLLRSGDEAHGTNFVIAPILPRLLLFTLPATGARGRGEIRGRVLSAESEPIQSAAVNLLRGGTTLLLGMTDAAGEYRFEGLPPGDFTVEASKPGYVTMQHGQLRINQLGRVVTLGDREAAEGIDVVLPRGNAIVGTVMDEQGEPLQGVTVDVLQLRFVGNRLTARRSGTSRQTDDYGRYRVFGLVPGRYLVRASVDEEVTGPDGDRTPQGYAPVYFPGSPRAEEASAVGLDLGFDATGINLVFARSPVARVAGVVSDAAGTPVTGTVTLATSQRSGGIALDLREVPIGASGGFMVTNVPPGEYVAQARGVVSLVENEPASGAVAANGAGVPEFGMQFVTVRDRDPEPVFISVSRPSTISGRIIIEGRPDTYAAEMSVESLPADLDYSPVNVQSRVVTVARDRTFSMTGLTGPTRLALRRSAESWYVRSIRIAGVDAVDVPFNVGLKGADYPNVAIVVSAAGAEISGQVTDEQDHVVEDCSVIVFATGRDKWFRGSQRLKFARPNREGVFRVPGLPPGEYWVAAVEALEGTAESGDWERAEVLQRLSLQAEKVAVGQGAIHTGRFRLIRR